MGERRAHHLNTVHLNSVHYSLSLGSVDAVARDGSGRRHSRDDVARAALDILDRFGLPDLTMRRLAAELDVQPSALYWHFPNKQSLLAEVSGRIIADVEAAPPGLDWPERVAFDAFALRAALLAHRDGAEVVASTLALGLGTLGAPDASGAPDAPDVSAAGRVLVDAIGAGGFDDATARRAASVLLRFVLGHVTHEQQQRLYASLLGGGVASGDSAAGVASGDSAAGEASGDSAAGVASGDSAAGEASADTAAEAEVEFRFGVTLMIGGLQRRLEEAGEG